MSKTKDYQLLAQKILDAVGGASNVVNVTHCITRLRFTLKDESIPDDKQIEAFEGVLGVMRTAGQYQVIIGQVVDKVYAPLCKIGNFTTTELDNEKKDEKLTLKKIGNNILDALAGCLTPLIPMLITAAMFKTLTAVFGPDMLGLISADDNLYKLFTFVGDAGFYFFPVIIGFTAAKKFNVTPVLGMFLGGIMIHPTLINMVTEGVDFTVYGIACSVQNYTATIFPIILSVWVMSYIEKFFKKYIPASLKTVFSPFLTMAIMLPLALCILGPAGGFIGNYISEGILMLGNLGGIFTIIAIALIGALWQFLVITGMHWLLITTMTVVISSTGAENVVSAATVSACFSVGGMCLGTFLRAKTKEEKSLAFSSIIAQVIGGVTEPGLYGIGFKYKRPFIGMMIGGFVGGLYGAVTGVTAYSIVPVANFLALLGYTGGSTANLINAIISGVIAFVVGAIATYIIGIEKGNKI